MDVHPPKNGIFIGIDPYPYHLFVESEPTNIHRQVIATKEPATAMSGRCSSCAAAVPSRVDPGSAGNMSAMYGILAMDMIFIIQLFTNVCISMYIYTIIYTYIQVHIYIISYLIIS